MKIGVIKLVMDALLHITFFSRSSTNHRLWESRASWWECRIEGDSTFFPTSPECRWKSCFANSTPSLNQTKKVGDKEIPISFRINESTFHSAYHSFCVRTEGLVQCSTHNLLFVPDGILLLSLINEYFVIELEVVLINEFFLDASTYLFIRLCWSVRPSVR